MNFRILLLNQGSLALVEVALKRMSIHRWERTSCQFLDGVQCTIPAYIRDAGEKELLWLLDEANIDWELYKVFPKDPLPQVSRIKKGENYGYKYGTV